MQQRSVKSITSTPVKYVGNLETRSALGELNENATDPFLVLSHHGPQTFAPHNTGMPFSDHPHRGFETVTFVFEGSLVHSDSGGHASRVESGGVQWMTAGTGVIHNEQVPADFMEQGGVLEITQLWINLPSKFKAVAPSYTGVQEQAIPALALPGRGGTIHLVSGSYADVHGPIESLTGIFMSWVELAKDALVVLPAPRSRTVLLFVLHGDVAAMEQKAGPGDLISFGNDGDCIALQAPAGAKLIFAHGTPIAEPVVAYGPFVMNTRDEIALAFRDYESGKYNKPHTANEVKHVR